MLSARLCSWRVLILGALCLSSLLTGCETLNIGNGGVNLIFDWSVTPDQQTVPVGGQTTYAITILSKVNSSDTVALSVDGLPTGTTATFSQSTIPSTSISSTLTIQTTTATPVGTHTLTILATEAGQTAQHKDVILTVQNNPLQGDFSLEVDPTEFTFDNVEYPKTFNYTVRSLNGFQGTITVSVSGLSDDLALSTAPTPPSMPIGPPESASGVFSLRASPTAPIVSPVDITVTATSGSITHTRTIRIIIPQ